jgi:LmbE family N-acetylglucosaminyl deacetylase
MSNIELHRRKFVQQAVIGIGAIAIPSLKNEQIKADDHSTEKKLNVVCIGAHPGDPEFGCGGTLAKYSDAGHQVSIIYLTRGEASDSSKTYQQMAALRTREAEIACNTLKATAIFAGQIDANTELNKKSIEDLTKLIMMQQPDIVFTHWPLDTHQDHQIAGLVGFNAWAKSNRAFQLYYYEVNTGSETLDFTPTDYVDITSVRDRKKIAMFAHKTQSPQEVYASFFKTMEEFRGLEAGVPAAEGFICFKPGAERARLMGL